MHEHTMLEWMSLSYMKRRGIIYERQGRTKYEHTVVLNKSWLYTSKSWSLFASSTPASDKQ